MDTVTLSLEVVNSIFEYLGTKPYNEVHKLFKAVEQDALNHIPMPTESKPKKGAA
jgi:hypothetical protein